MARREERFLEEQELSIQRRNMSGALASRRDGNRPESVAYFVLDASPYAVMSQDVEMAAGDHVSRYDATVFAALLVVLSDPRPAEASVCVAGARHGEDWVVTPTKDFKNFHTRLSQNESDPPATSKGSTTIELCLKKVRLMLRRHTKNEKIGVYVFLSRVEIESDLDAFDDLLSSMSSKCDLHLVCLAPDGASLETILTADDNIKVSTWEGPKSCWFKFLFDGKEPILPRSLLFTYKTVWEETFGCPCPAALSSRLDRIKKETEEERVKQLKAVLSGHYGTYSSVNAVIRPGTEDTSPSRSPISQLPPPPPPPPLPLLLPSCGRQSSVGHQLTTQVMESALKPGPEQGILKIYAEPLFRLRVGKLLKSVGAFLSKGKGKMKLSGSKKRGSLELWLQLDGSFSLVFLSDEDRRGGRSPELIARTPTYVRLEAGEVSTLRLKTLEGDPSGRSFTVGRSDGRGKVQVGTCFYLVSSLPSFLSRFSLTHSFSLLSFFPLKRSTWKKRIFSTNSQSIWKVQMDCEFVMSTRRLPTSWAAWSRSSPKSLQSSRGRRGQ